MENLEQIGEIFDGLHLTYITWGWADEPDPPNNRRTLLEAADQFTPHMVEDRVYYHAYSASAVWLSTETGEFRAGCPLYWKEKDQDGVLVFVGQKKR